MSLPWANIRLFAMDVDGILTDGRVGVSAAPDSEMKFFSLLDGLGLARVRDAGIALAWISGRQSGATQRRAEELKIPYVIQGRTDKLAALQELAGKLALSAGQCVYMGDDDIDTPAIRWAGIGVTVPTAMPSPLAAAHYVTTRPAGFGAVREICELILLSRPS
jgi:3-deoxy-D-manno-octulosonate 8-phosphate phosphatase (KDO 8-P phosphatase)